MCGVCGIVASSDAFRCDEATVVAMRDTMTHRGPDDAGAIVRPEERVALGHRRLSIVDLSSAGRQPLANADGSMWITYNGEVYNHEALRAELEARGHRFRSRTDTEVVLHLYEEHGPAALERLEGMFAFAIWDARRRELFLARDRIGVKPLYFSAPPGGFVFASEIKALLAHPAVRAELDEEALHDYLTFGFTPPPATMFKGIAKLAPAEWARLPASGPLERGTYWQPFDDSVAAEVRTMSETDMEVRLRELLRASIGKRMMSDVPFGVFLSGGLDSSTNVALMAELTDRPIRTFSTAPAGHPRYDELSHARTVAERFSTDHHEVAIDEEDMLEFLPRMVFHEDEPLADWTAIPQHFVSQLARDSGTVVVQCGEGADEILHGYKGYVDHRRYVLPFQRIPRPLRRPIGVAAARATRRAGRGVRHGEALYDAGHSRLPFWGGAICFRGEVKDRILAGGNGANSYGVVETHWDAASRSGADLFQHMTYVELKQRLPELLLMRLDKIAMASSVEAREPFLDHHLVEFAMALPPRAKFRHGQGKHVLRRAMRGLLPDEIIDRPKQGFGTPMEEWLCGDFGREAAARIRSSGLAERGLLDYETMDAIIAAHREGRGDWSKHIWNVYGLSTWYDRWIEGASPA